MTDQPIPTTVSLERTARRLGATLRHVSEANAERLLAESLREAYDLGWSDALVVIERTIADVAERIRRP